MSAMKELLCIICNELVCRSDMMNHIAEDINYIRFRCKECLFKTTHLQAIVEHELDTSHIVVKGGENRYLERLCTIIYSDCVLQAKNGIDAVFERKLQSPATPFSARDAYTTDKNTNATSLDTDVVNKNVEADEMEIDVLETPTVNKVVELVDVTENDHEYVQPKTIKNINAEKRNVARNLKAFDTNKEKRCKPSPKKTAEVRTKKDERAHKRLNFLEANKTASNQNLVLANCENTTNNDGDIPIHNCAKCSLMVPNDYRSHKEHVLKYHVDDYDGAMDDRLILLSKCIECCFPKAISSNDYQCTICGHEIRSYSGRRRHACAEHLYHSLNCPSRGCSATFFVAERLSRHLKNSHLSGDSLDAEERMLLKHTKEEYNNGLRILLDRCFPYPLPDPGMVNHLLSLPTSIIAEEHSSGEIAENEFNHKDSVVALENEQPCITLPSMADNSANDNTDGVQRTNWKGSVTSDAVDPALASSSATAIASRQQNTKVAARLICKEEIKQENEQYGEKKRQSISETNIPSSVANSNERYSSSDERSSIASNDASRASRRLKIAQMVDEINNREAERRRKNGAFRLKNSQTRTSANKRGYSRQNLDSSSSSSSTEMSQSTQNSNLKNNTKESTNGREQDVQNFRRCCTPRPDSSGNGKASPGRGGRTHDKNAEVSWSNDKPIKQCFNNKCCGKTNNNSSAKGKNDYKLPTNSKHDSIRFLSSSNKREFLAMNRKEKRKQKQIEKRKFLLEAAMDRKRNRKERNLSRKVKREADINKRSKSNNLSMVDPRKLNDFCMQQSKALRLPLLPGASLAANNINNASLLNQMNCRTDAYAKQCPTSTCYDFQPQQFFIRPKTRTSSVDNVVPTPGMIPLTSGFFFRNDTDNTTFKNVQTHPHAFQAFSTLQLINPPTGMPLREHKNKPASFINENREQRID